MVSWKGLAALLVLLAALGGYLAWSSRSGPSAPAAFIPCDATNAVDFVVEGQGSVVEISRSVPLQPWRVVRPVQAPADPVFADSLPQSLHSIKPDDVIADPGPAAQYGLDSPHAVVTCRVSSGSSFTLTIGKGSFDQGGYYARKGGDPRVYVIPGTAVDDFDRRLKDPPVQTGAGASPSPSPTK